MTDATSQQPSFLRGVVGRVVDAALPGQNYNRQTGQYAVTPGQVVGGVGSAAAGLLLGPAAGRLARTAVNGYYGQGVGANLFNRGGNATPGAITHQPVHGGFAPNIQNLGFGAPQFNNTVNRQPSAGVSWQPNTNWQQATMDAQQRQMLQTMEARQQQGFPGGQVPSGHAGFGGVGGFAMRNPFAGSISGDAARDFVYGASGGSGINGHLDAFGHQYIDLT